MADSPKARLAELLRKNQRRRAVPELVRKWREQGVTVSVLADDRQRAFVERLRAGVRSKFEPVHDLHGAISAVLGRAELAIVVDWQLEYAPALG